MNEQQKGLSSLIRRVRLSRFESELEFALRIGSSPEAVKAYESGDIIPTTMILQSIRAAAINAADEAALDEVAGA